jgi:hypothetical protein
VREEEFLWSEEERWRSGGRKSEGDHERRFVIISENMSWIDETTALSVMEQKDARSGSVY